MPDADYCRLPLRARDGSIKAYALVSPEDFDELNRYRWFMQSTGYVARVVQLHREILGPTDAKMVVDHINGKPLDNRRENLRIATRTQNSHNTKARGTYRRRQDGRYVARAGRAHLGVYDSEDKARRVAAAYKSIHWPFSPDARRDDHQPEDIADALKFRVPPARLTPYGALSARLMLISTTLQHQEIAEILGISKQQMSAIVHRRAWASIGAELMTRDGTERKGRPVASTEDTAAMLRLAREGWTQQRIANCFGLSRYQIQRLLARGSERRRVDSSPADPSQ